MGGYELGVAGAFPAKHYLIGGDFGPENELHGHDYRVELVLESEVLDEHGFIVDIDRVKREMAALLDTYRGQTLNDMPELSGLNPSCEHFARVLAQGMCDRLELDASSRLTGLSIKLWEDDIAWASFRLDPRDYSHEEAE